MSEVRRFVGIMSSGILGVVTAEWPPMTWPLLAVVAMCIGGACWYITGGPD